MKKLILFMFMIAAFSAESKVLFQCQILTQDEKIPKKSLVSYTNKVGETVSNEPDDEGIIRVFVDSEYFVELTFSAVDHISISQKFPIPINLDTINLMAKLIPNQIYNDLEAIYLVGSFNGFDFDTAVEMRKNEDNTFSYLVEYDSDTLKYQIYPKFLKSPSNRTFNGSMSDSYEYDGAGDYRSVIINPSRKFEIKFDPKYFPSGEFLSLVDFQNEDYADWHNNYIKILREFDAYLGDRSMVFLDQKLSNEEKTAKSLQLKKDYMSRVSELTNQISDPNIRITGILEYLHIAHDGVNVRGVEDLVDKKLIQEIYSVSPSSSLWSKGSKYYQAVFAEILLGKVQRPEYLLKIIDSEQPNDTKAGILSLLVTYCHYNELEDLKDEYYDMLMKQFPDTKEAARTRANFGKDKNIVLEKRIPDFSLKNLDDDSETISPAKLRGKYVLIDVWGTWCMPCLLEIPHLVEAYNKFKDMNFTIYSVAIDASASQVKKFRDSKNKMPWLPKEKQIETNLPWLHSYGGSWESDIVSIFEVVGVPTAFLIDPEGKIIATEGLRGELLMETLEKFIK
ncbi:MAG: TlpA family protein disulfide reductase [Candidatus Kapabacteria bacterium]|nr:TlpA family protein disulfide reductase [Ignavibacteriota bacterium]MCW5883744.1 TlpA family protein disulfide reductase [Candidatus Kapabacteria bacterium]